jgi:hypothetical protein
MKYAHAYTLFLIKHIKKALISQGPVSGSRLELPTFGL